MRFGCKIYQVVAEKELNKTSIKKLAAMLSIGFACLVFQKYWNLKILL